MTEWAVLCRRGPPRARRSDDDGPRPTCAITLPGPRNGSRVRCRRAARRCCEGAGVAGGSSLVTAWHSSPSTCSAQYGCCPTERRRRDALLPSVPAKASAAGVLPSGSVRRRSTATPARRPAHTVTTPLSVPLLVPFCMCVSVCVVGGARYSAAAPQTQQPAAGGELWSPTLDVALRECRISSAGVGTQNWTGWLTEYAPPACPSARLRRTVAVPTAAPGLSVATDALRFAPVRRGGAADVSFEIDALERSAGSVRRYASLSLPPLPLIVSYRSNKSLCGTAPLRTARPSQ